MKKVLKTQPAPKMSKKLMNSYSFKADDAARKQPVESTPGIGSSFAMALDKDKSNPIKEQRKQKAEIGGIENLGLKKEQSVASFEKKKRVL